MTNAPVKDVSSLMNFVGTKRMTPKTDMTQTESFGDVMSRASGGNTDLLERTSKPDVQSVKQPKESASKTEQPVKKQETDAVQEKSPAKAEVGKEEKQAVEEAGKEVVKEIAEELGISEEEVVEAMEELGLSFSALFDPGALTQLVLQLSGETDMTALITDEGLFSKLQDLIGKVGSIKDNLMQELNVNPEEMQALLQEVKALEEAETSVNAENGMPASEMTNAAQTDAAEEASEKNVEIEIKVNGETVKVSADEKGNIQKTLTVTAENSSAGSGEMSQQQSSDMQEGSKENFHTGNPVLDSLLQNKVQAAEVPVEQPMFFNANTQEIMNQIMDYMKIQLKPGMDQLQMQLHPASLGTVQVQLTSKGGEITAQFQVQNETVKAAIEGQIAELKESLRDQGVKVEAVEVTVESNGFESSLWQGQGREENATSQNGRRSTRRINLNDLDALFEDEASEEEALAAKVMEANGNTVDYTA